MSEYYTTNPNVFERIRTPIKARYSKAKEFVGDQSENITNLFQSLKKPFIFGIFAVIVIILTVIVLIKIFSTSAIKVKGKTVYTKSSTAARDTRTAFIILTVVGLVACLLILFLPSLRALKTFIFKFKSVFMVVIYLIALIIFFRDSSTTFTDKYSYIILPITLFIGIWLFYTRKFYSYNKFLI
jgi:hypothetical protein